MALVGACGGRDASPKVRHIILITLDTTRADHLGCYGNPAVQTPALDQLASEGVRFASCASAASTTLASHASILTGTYPHRHGVPRNGFTLSERARTLAEVLDEAGFWCAGFLGSAALTGRTGIDQGFVHWDEDFDEAALRAHLAAHGVEAGETGRRYGATGFGPSIYLRDPDGNVVELKGSGAQDG